MPIPVLAFERIVSLISDSKLAENQLSQQFEKIATELSLLNSDEINSRMPIKSIPGLKANVVEIALYNYLTSLENPQENAKRIEHLYQVLDFMFSLKTVDINSKNPSKLHGVGEQFGLLHLALSENVKNDEPIDRHIKICMMFK